MGGSMVNRHLSRDQKRKQKLARRGSSQPTQLAGVKKYRAEKYIKAVMRAEMGIHESDVMLHRALTDREVAASLRELILELRSAAANPAEQVKAAEASATLGGGAEMIGWNIKRNWQELFATEPRHSDAELAGILDLILDSISNWSSMGRGPRAYLDFIEGFLGRLGVQVVEVPGRG